MSINDSDTLITQLLTRPALTAIKKQPMATLATYRKALLDHRRQLKQLFAQRTPVADLMQAHTAFIDCVLHHAWQRSALPSDGGIFTVTALGSYGRAELSLYSDIDLLITYEDTIAFNDCASQLSAFITFLWDLGLEIGHRVCSLEQCQQAATEDVIFLTNLLDARPVIRRGQSAHFSPPDSWPAATFFAAKQREQQLRHRKHDDTAFSLEPHIKDSPGGLRDIEIIIWIAKHCFQLTSWDCLVTQGFLSTAEYNILHDARAMLWRVRFALHTRHKRREDRLLLDYQAQIAKQLGYRDLPHKLAVEQLMKRYYRTVKTVRELTTILLQLMQERITPQHNKTATPINPRFMHHDGCLSVTTPDVFQQHPAALLEVFLLAAEHPDVTEISASTSRLINRYSNLIDSNFRRKKEHQALFMRILGLKKNAGDTLRQMNRLPVLGNYIPTFGQIIGQMQYDLFHAYTVDAHSLFVVHNLQQFTDSAAAEKFPLCATIMSRIKNTAVLIIAALFHDIAKGRGGDHSELGAQYVQRFCRTHRLCEQDCKLAHWLVREHLLMSTTAQKKDLTSAYVLKTFAETVQTPERLDHLYVLTVADICATNKTLWNSWKDRLLRELYSKTQYLLAQPEAAQLDLSDTVQTRKTQAAQLVSNVSLSCPHLTAHFARLPQHYFLSYTAKEIAAHYTAIRDHGDNTAPLVSINPELSQGATEIMIYTRARNTLFAATTGSLDRMQLSVVNAVITRTTDQYHLDTYWVLDQHSRPIDETPRIKTIVQKLQKGLKANTRIKAQAFRRISRQMRYFKQPTRVIFHPHVDNSVVLEVISPDRPGLLARVGLAFVECGVHLHKAKIATCGERVEDLFFITGSGQRPLLTEAQQTTLAETICHYLDHNHLRNS